MTFTKKMSQQNQAMAKRAADLLVEYDWKKEDEDAAASVNSWNPYIRAMGDRIARQLYKEFPDVPPKRARSQAFNVMVRARSKR